jgi:hypothetical protein
MLESVSETGALENIQELRLAELESENASLRMAFVLAAAQRSVLDEDLSRRDSLRAAS